MVEHIAVDQPIGLIAGGPDTYYGQTTVTISEKISVGVYAVRFYIADLYYHGDNLETTEAYWRTHDCSKHPKLHIEDSRRTSEDPKIRSWDKAVRRRQDVCEYGALCVHFRVSLSMYGHAG